MTEQQREAFEKWADSEGLSTVWGHTGYLLADTAAAWKAWQAALSHAEGEAVAEVTTEPDYWSRGHFYEGRKKDIKILKGLEDIPVGTKLYTRPAPQVAVPEAITKYDGYVPPEDGSAGEYYVDGWNSCRDALLANSAPAQTVSASVPEQKTWNQAGGREDLRYTEGWNDCRAAMLATAPTAPAGELVTRCTAGLGCDEKGHCDAAATGQGDMCDRRTMAHEQPVSDPDGLPEPGRREAEQAYINGAFDYARDPIGSRDWVLFWNGWQARDKSAPSPDEREIAALALERHADNLIVMAERDGRNNDRESQQTWEEAAYFAKQEAARLRAGKEGE